MISLSRTLAAFTIGFAWVSLSAQAFTVPVSISQQQVRTSSLFPTRSTVRPSLASSPSDDENVGSGKSESLLTVLTDYGQSLKPKAEKASANAYQADDKGRKVLFTLQTCLYYVAFIVFRGYRGFFVLLPAVFRKVYTRLENAIDYELDEDDRTVATSSSSTPKWRTKITVSLLAGIVTASYVVGGMLRVFGKFLRTMTQTSSVKGSFEAAADQVEQNETRIRRRIVNINGEDEEAAANSEGLTP